MRAHFAGDVVVATEEAPTDGIDKIENVADAAAEADAEPLNARIDEFKQDSKNMEVVSEFIDDVLQKAEEEAVKQQEAKSDKNSQQPKEKTRQSFTIPDLKNGKMVNRARGLVVRIFDAICNCANTAAGPAQRIKLRAKRAASLSTAAATENGTDSKKQDVNGKEKKGNKKQQKEAAANAAKEQAAVEENGANQAQEDKDKAKIKEEPEEKKEAADDAAVENGEQEQQSEAEKAE